MPTLVNELSFSEPSYNPSEKERSRDAAQAVATGRVGWKALRGTDEAVWSPSLEAALLEALKKFEPKDYGTELGLRRPGRFHMRNRFISDYIFETAGKRRTPRQVGSRLQQLRLTCNEEILKLLPNRCPSEPVSTDLDVPQKIGEHSVSGYKKRSTSRCQPESESTPLVQTNFSIPYGQWPGIPYQNGHGHPSSEFGYHPPNFYGFAPNFYWPAPNFHGFPSQEYPGPYYHYPPYSTPGNFNFHHHDVDISSRQICPYYYDHYYRGYY